MATIVDKLKQDAGGLSRAPEHMNAFWRCAIDEYGCRRGWAKGRVSELYAMCGGHRRSRCVDWKRVKRLVFVCRGNICRSPYARARASLLGADSASFGLEVRAAASPDSAIRTAADNGIDLSSHSPAGLDAYDQRSGDLIVGFEPRHIRDAVPAIREAAGRATLLGMWTRRPRPFVQDPYGLGETYYSRCFALIDEAVENMADRMVNAGGGSLDA